MVVLDELEANAEEKRFYERFWALHSDPELVKVFKQFGPGVFRRSSVLEGFEDIIQEGGFKGGLCVEIGTCNGLTAVVLSRYFDQVVSLDILPQPQKHFIIEALGKTNITFVDVKDNAEKAAFIKKLGFFSAAYVDGDHAHDTADDFALVADCGRVLFHEYWPAQPPVWNLVNNLKRNGKVLTRGKFAIWTS